ncbi:MAG: M28 family peptidase, partial [Gemmatimonadota bacterium]
MTRHAIRRLTALLITITSTAAAQSRASHQPVWPDEGPMTWAPRPTESAITANDLRTRLYQIADDSMRGRRIGETGNAKVTDYIAREFARLGLRPAGDNGTWSQSLPYGAFGVDAASARLAIGGSALDLRRDWLPTAPSAINGVTARADLRDVPDKFGADAVIAFEAAQRAQAQNRPPAPRPALPVNRFRRAIDAGAVGVLVVALDGMSETARTGVLTPTRMMQPARVLGTDGTLAAATISQAAATRLFGGRAVASLTPGTTGSRLTARWNYAFTRAPAENSRNVIAMLPGADPTLASEYVLVGAHNDHVGVNTAPVDHDSLRAVNTITRRQGANDPACVPTPAQQRAIDSLIARARAIRPARLDSISNGADDDGSGTVVLLEIAERFAKEKPARSILFISHQGEEAGLLGSRWFVDHPTVDLTKIVAAHNMDMLGKGRADQVKYGGPNSVQMLGARRLSREFGDVIDSVNANSPEPMAIDRSWDVTHNPLNRFCRSDQVSYVSKDIPVTYFSLGYAQDYHQVTDEPQYIEYDHSARLGRFIYDV